MWKFLPTVGVLAATAFALPSSSPQVALANTASPGPCASDSVNDIEFMLNRYRWMMSGDDSLRVSVRTTAALAKVDPATITVVADTAICRAAVVAYGNALNDTTSNRSVNVVKIGSRYVVRDPARLNGSGAYLTFDSTFTTKLSQTR